MAQRPLVDDVPRLAPRHDGVLDVRGSYAAGDGPDWGWRTEIHPDADALRWVMYNVTPEGEEALAVRRR